MTINEFNFSGKKAIVRVDFNVPLDENGNITDDTRQIAAQIPTPFHIYDEAGIRENVRQLKAAFAWNPGFQHEHFEKIYNIIRDFADKLVETVLSMGVKFKANNKTYVINDELFDISSAILKIEAFRDSLIDLKSQYSTKISLENLFGDTIEELDKEIGLLKNFK